MLQGQERPSYRADHVGSFLRPPALLEAVAARDPELRQLEDDAILDVLRLQQEVFREGSARRVLGVTA